MPDLPLVEALDLGLDAWTAARRLAHLPHLLFLDSAATTTPLGRYSFVCADPFGWLESRSGKTRWIFNGTIDNSVGNPLHVLAALLENYRGDRRPGLPPFQGGAAGLFGYDLARHIERLPNPKIDEFKVPELALGFYDWVIAFDHVQEKSWLISTGLPAPEVLSRQTRARLRLDAVRKLLAASEGPAPSKDSGVPIQTAPRYPVEGFPGLFSNFSRESYLEAIRRAVEFIHAGDCFQVNIAQRLLHPMMGSPLELYGRLRQRNAAPFAAYFDMGDSIILSASPERFLQVEKNHVLTRPIKGTRPRGKTPSEDQAFQEELLHSAKDRAENVMIIDLLRNDLGRVCSYGSVDVTAVCQLETYPTVHHLVSEVRGTLRPGVTSVDLLRAAFPGGSVTGAPKVRAMEIINELEPTVRAAYCGSLGYLGFDGTMDTNILIRTFTAARGWLQFPVGGGIVADSTPENEYAETLHKAEGLLRALR